MTVLHMAAAVGNVVILSLLPSVGADEMMRSSEGAVVGDIVWKTFPLDTTKQYEHEERR